MKKLLIFLILTATLMSSCERIRTIRPSGRVTTEYRFVESFDKISVNGGIDLVAYNGGQEILVEANQNLHEHIEVFVRAGNLVIRPRPHINFGIKARITVYVTAESINCIDASGGSKVKIPNGIRAEYFCICGSGGSKFEGDISGNEIRMNLSGGGKAELDVICDKLTALGSGGSVYELNGESRLMDINMSGGGKMEAYNLLVEELNVHLSGGAHVEITVVDYISYITGNLSGGSRLKYKGIPGRLEVGTSGGSTITSKN